MDIVTGEELSSFIGQFDHPVKGEGNGGKGSGLGRTVMLASCEYYFIREYEIMRIWCNIQVIIHLLSLLIRPYKIIIWQLLDYFK